MDICRYDPACLALINLLEEAIAMSAMADACRVLIIQADRRATGSTDLLEGVPSEALIAHDIIVAAFLECLLHPIQISLERFRRSLPGPLEEFFTFVGRNGCNCR
ncbi:hypothetical protein C476_17552 [Natrinema limicola JCM 13563]|uniref:Uncharacterized protein n=1 Tax=Natrinema limicola JCM 13563 TaxID=1230457 RepID=M0BXJ9_9EURY|nr:hypothetical protein C476_17552 [Natrinema limicola JCM 13563]